VRCDRRSPCIKFSLISKPNSWSWRNFSLLCYTTSVPIFPGPQPRLCGRTAILRLPRQNLMTKFGGQHQTRLRPLLRPMRPVAPHPSELHGSSGNHNNLSRVGCARMVPVLPSRDCDMNGNGVGRWEQKDIELGQSNCPMSRGSKDVPRTPGSLLGQPPARTVPGDVNVPLQIWTSLQVPRIMG